MGTLDAILQDCRELLKHPCSYVALLAFPLMSCGKSEDRGAAIDAAMKKEMATAKEQAQKEIEETRYKHAELEKELAEVRKKLGEPQAQPNPPAHSPMPQSTPSPVPQQPPSTSEPQTLQSKIIGKWIDQVDGNTCEFYKNGKVEITLWKGEPRKPQILDYEFLTDNKLMVKGPGGSVPWVTILESAKDSLKVRVETDKSVSRLRRYPEGAPSLEVRARAASAPAALKDPEITFVFHEGYAQHLSVLSTPTLHLKNAGTGVMCLKISPGDIQSLMGSGEWITRYGVVNRGGQELRVELPLVKASSNQALFAGESTDIEFGLKIDSGSLRTTDKKEEAYSGKIGVLWEAQDEIKKETVPLTIRIIPHQPQPLELQRSIDVAVQEGEFRRYTFAAKAENAYMVVLQANDNWKVQPDDLPPAMGAERVSKFFEMLKLFREDQTPPDGHTDYALFKDKIAMFFGHQPTGKLMLQLNTVKIHGTDLGRIAGKLTATEAKPVPFSKFGADGSKLGERADGQYVAGTPYDLSEGGKYPTALMALPFEAEEGASYLMRAHHKDQSLGRSFLISYVCPDSDLDKVITDATTKPRAWERWHYDKAVSPGANDEAYNTWTCPKSGKYWIAMMGGEEAKYIRGSKAPIVKFWLYSFPKK